ASSGPIDAIRARRTVNVRPSIDVERPNGSSTEYSDERFFALDASHSRNIEAHAPGGFAGVDTPPDGGDRVRWPFSGPLNNLCYRVPRGADAQRTRVSTELEAESSGFATYSAGARALFEWVTWVWGLMGLLAPRPGHTCVRLTGGDDQASRNRS